ncbi:MAG TPA: hypothetical protein VH643_15295 [Gemmataceae bacterium]|jgi:hypothetical protein
MVRASLTLILVTAAVSAAQAAPVPADAPKVIRLAPQSTAKQASAFRYRLLPDPLDRTPGNAAPLWRFAADAARNAKRRLSPKEDVWAGETPLQRLPRKEVADFLAHYNAAFRLARQAACRTHCDWEIPPLTLQSLTEGFFPLALVQSCRELAQLLVIRFRLQLVEGRFDEAAETLQTGFALAQHLRESDSFIQHLVGIAVAAIMFSHVEEWMQTPGSPNLYWALTALPRPLESLRRPFEHEFGTFYRSFPRLRRLRRETFTAGQVEDLTKEVFENVSKAMGDIDPKKAEAFRKLGESIRKGEQYPQARQHLLDLGRTAKELDAMPKNQVVLLWHLDQYDRVRDDVFKALALPPWQGSPLMDEATKELSAAGNPVISLLMPAAAKVYKAHLRSERELAGLRCVEALRLYAAAHEGKPPAKWSDITAVPLPINPVTGKGFEDYYQMKEGRALLDVPAQPFFVGRRYELAPPR